MQIPPATEDDILAMPLAARLFELLVELRRPATTQELAERAARHPNTIRAQLVRLTAHGLVTRRTIRQARGRPRDEWAIAPEARPAGRAPDGHADLARWLARAIATSRTPEEFEQAGREIGRELAPGRSHRPTAESIAGVLSALGFAPAYDADQLGDARFVLRNCPYRDAVRENPAVVCTLHRGITLGLLDRLDPGARLRRFVAKDPETAGCLIEVAIPATRPAENY